MIWTSTKLEYSTIKDNSSWMLSNDNFIKFWSEVWCGTLFRWVMEDSIFDDRLIVSKLISNQNWNFDRINPPILDLIKDITRRCHIPFELHSNKLRWNLSSLSDLSLKLAYKFKRGNYDFS